MSAAVCQEILAFDQRDFFSQFWEDKKDGDFHFLKRGYILIFAVISSLCPKIEVEFGNIYLHECVMSQFMVMRV